MTFPKFDVKESLKVDSHHNNTLGIFHVIGKRGSGKTVLIKNLTINLMTLNKIKNVIIFNNNRTQYTDIIENVENIERALTVENLKTIVEMQSEKYSKPLLIILENIYLDEKLTSSEYFKEIFEDKKKLKITIILSTQHPIGLNSDLRSCIDFILSFKEDSTTNIRSLREYYFTGIPTDKILEKIFYKLGEYVCLVSVRLKNGTRLENCVQCCKVNNMDFSHLNKIESLSMKMIDQENTNLTDINCKDVIGLIKINNKKIEELHEKNNYLINMLNYKITNV